MDLERQYEIAFSYDCYGPFVRLMALAGLDEAEVIEVEATVDVPATVRQAYDYLYRRGVAIMTIVERAYPVPREYAAAMVEVQRLVDRMAKGGI